MLKDCEAPAASVNETKFCKLYAGLLLETDCTVSGPVPALRIASGSVAV